MQREEEASGAQQLPVSEEEMRRAADLIAHAKRLVVFSGAGISAESGIATFRDPEMGLWTSKIGLAWFGTPIGWRWTPGLAWRMYLSRFRDPIARARPNPGHYAIARLEQLIDQGQALGKDVPRHFGILTQNVDGLHQRAGNKETSVAELHGTVNRHICSKHRHPHPYVIDPAALAEDYDPEKDEFFTHDSKKVPRCPAEGCGSYLRPDAVLFMEGLPSHAWNAADCAVSSATLAALKLAHLMASVEQVRLLMFGSPRVFSWAGAAYFKRLGLGARTLRVAENGVDPVMMVNLGSLGFKHVGLNLRVEKPASAWPHLMEGYMAGFMALTTSTFAPSFPLGSRRALLRLLRLH